MGPIATHFVLGLPQPYWFDPVWQHATTLANNMRDIKMGLRGQTLFILHSVSTSASMQNGCQTDSSLSN